MSDYRPDPLGAIGYSPSTGEFIWLKPGPGRPLGLKAGCVTPSGYVMLHYGGKRMPAHHLAWRIMTGKWPEVEIDHANRVRDDNRFENLREATRSQNSQNAAKRQRNTSGFKGVSWSNRNRKWRAVIMAKRVRTELGLFATPEEAHAAYAKAAKELHGEFHCLD